MAARGSAPSPAALIQRDLQLGGGAHRLHEPARKQELSIRTSALLALGSRPNPPGMLECGRIHTSEAASDRGSSFGNRSSAGGSMVIAPRRTGPGLSSRTRQELMIRRRRRVLGKPSLPRCRAWNVRQVHPGEPVRFSCHTPEPNPIDFGRCQRTAGGLRGLKSAWEFHHRF